MAEAIKKATRTKMKSYGLREKAWWVLRNKKETTIENLMNTLCNGNEKDGYSNLRKYLRALERAGIIKRAPQRVPGMALTSNGFLRYILVKDVGQEAPVWRQKRNEIFCPATFTSYPLETKLEAQHG